MLLAAVVDQEGVPTKVGDNGDGRTAWRVEKRWFLPVVLTGSVMLVCGLIFGSTSFGTNAGVRVGGGLMGMAGAGGLLTAGAMRFGRRLAWVQDVQDVRWQQATESGERSIDYKSWRFRFWGWAMLNGDGTAQAMFNGGLNNIYGQGGIFKAKVVKDVTDSREHGDELNGETVWRVMTPWFPAANALGLSLLAAGGLIAGLSYWGGNAVWGHSWVGVAIFGGVVAVASVRFGTKKVWVKDIQMVFWQQQIQPVNVRELGQIKVASGDSNSV
jgi:hypothetical protein